MPLSDNAHFTKSSFTREETLPAPAEDLEEHLNVFERMDFGVTHKGGRREFSYESETARNFNDNNVNKAKIGVKEIMADAINKAKSQVNQIKGEAHKEGFDAGFLEGLEKARVAAQEDFDPFLESLQNSIEHLSHFRAKMYGKVEREMIEMVVALAKRVIHFELSTHEGAVQAMIRLGVQSVLDREHLTIKINPEDKGYAESFRSELHHMFHDIKNITLSAHPGIQRGGCIVESNFGTIDSQIDQLDAQLDRILEMTPPNFEDDMTSLSPEEESAQKKAEEESAQDEMETPPDPSVP